MLCAKFDGKLLTTFKVSQKTFGLLFCGHGVYFVAWYFKLTRPRCIAVIVKDIS